VARPLAPVLARELIAAARSYETHASGLGADFIQQVEHTLADVVAHPNAGVLFAGSTIRRRLMHRFPFGVVYEIESGSSRSAKGWKTRVTEALHALS
jgi:hypothetical protein